METIKICCGFHHIIFCWTTRPVPSRRLYIYIQFNHHKQWFWILFKNKKREEARPRISISKTNSATRKCLFTIWINPAYNYALIYYESFKEHDTRGALNNYTRNLLACFVSFFNSQLRFTALFSLSFTKNKTEFDSLH